MPCPHFAQFEPLRAARATPHDRFHIAPAVRHSFDDPYMMSPASLMLPLCCHPATFDGGRLPRSRMSTDGPAWTRIRDLPIMSSATASRLVSVGLDIPLLQAEITSSETSASRPVSVGHAATLLPPHAPFRRPIPHFLLVPRMTIRRRQAIASKVAVSQYDAHQCRAEEVQSERSGDGLLRPPVPVAASLSVPCW